MQGIHRLSRRVFLKNVGRSCAVASMTLHPSPTASLNASSQNSIPGPRAGKKVRMGVVGGGFGSSFHWHEHPDSVVVAVADLREDRRKILKDKYGAPKVYVDFKEVVADKEVDAVAVFTGVPDHAWMSEYAMQHGKHVVCAVSAAMTLEECERLIDTVKTTGMTYMNAETSYYYPGIMTCRRWQQEGRFGTIFYSEGEYLHDIEDYRGKRLYFYYDGKPTWRLGIPPMLAYITHSSAGVVSVTGERLTSVCCVGFGHKDEALQKNPYGPNPFSNQVAFFKTSDGHAARISEFRHYGGGSTVRNEFYGTEMSYLDALPGSRKAMVGKPEKTTEYEVKPNLEMLPPELQKSSGHEGSHPHLTHEFVRSIVEERWPAINVYEAVAFCAPGIVAHQSALNGGEWRRIPDFGRAAQDRKSS
jgi:predicted dehydrogenase